MSLSRGKVNPLGILNLRRLSFIPEHFTKLKVEGVHKIKILDQWIEYSLNSRYAIKKTLVLDTNNNMVEVAEIGIEDPKEMSMFILVCPHLHTTT